MCMYRYVMVKICVGQDMFVYVLARTYISWPGQECLGQDILEDVLARTYMSCSGQTCPG